MNESEPNRSSPPDAAELSETPVLAERPEPEYPFWRYEDLAVFSLLLLPSLGAGWLIIRLLSAVVPMGEPTSAAQLLGMQFAGYVVWFGCLWLLLKLRYDRPFWRSLGWVKPRRGFFGAIIAGPVLALGLAALAVALNTPRIDSPIEKLIADRRSLVLVGVVASTVGPLAEELAFRGFIMPLLVRSFGAFFGVIATALPFALIHGPQYGFQWQNITILTLAACAFGVARLRSGSVIPSVVMHGLYNLTLFIGYTLHKDFSGTW